MARTSYLSFSDARVAVRRLGFPSAAEFRKWTTGGRLDLGPKPANIPSNPHQVYASEFKGYADFLGNGNLFYTRRQWAPFTKARAFVRSLHLDNEAQFGLYCQGKYSWLPPRPTWLPTNPNLTYRDKGWAGMRDWLGTGDPAEERGTKMRLYSEACGFARALGLRTSVEWRAYVEGKRPDLPPKPTDIPSIPTSCYRMRGWTTWADFLGSDTRAWHSSTWRPFAEARAFARKLGLRSMREWRQWSKENCPADIPVGPDRVYTRDWVSWADWLCGNASRRQ